MISTTMFESATEATAPFSDRVEAILSPDAVDFVERLHRRFEATRRRLLAERRERQSRIDRGDRPGFLRETASVRDADWTVAPAPPDLTDRRVEITGPVDRKMMINALNSGAKVFMADLEDSLSPTWHNVTEGQVNLYDAVRGTIEFTNPDGKEYRLGPNPATLMVRPRGWHLEERHLLIDGAPVSASLFDFGLFFFHNARELLQAGSGPYFYLPKLENHREARLWNDVFEFSQDALGIPNGSIRATVLIETILAAFEMDEILYELRDHSAGLNAGRWDYIFSIIKTFRNRPDMALPDRSRVTMTVPFMKAYTDLLIQTCHRRGAHAMGGMSAFIPTRSDQAANARAFEAVTADKQREARSGHDGTWVAHPGLVDVAADAFSAELGASPNQIDNPGPKRRVTATDLLNVASAGDSITESGMRLNIDVAIQYVASWLSGNGAAAIYNLMEDAATAEISRSQIWQWVHHGKHTDDGVAITRSRVSDTIDDVIRDLEELFGTEQFTGRRFHEARELFERVALGDDFPEFLTIPAYDKLD